MTEDDVDTYKKSYYPGAFNPLTRISVWLTASNSYYEELGYKFTAKGGLHQPHLNRHLANGHLTLSSH